MKVPDNVFKAILAISAVLTLVGIYMAFKGTPPHSTMGDVQRIFYFHVASAWVSYLAFGLTFAMGLFYMATGNLKWDNVAYSSAEIGVMFCAIAITTGPLWGKAVWGVYWRWEDQKLFMTLVLFLVFVSYLALRSNVPSRERRADLSAVFGIIGIVCIPLSAFANRIWQQYHPTVVATSQGSLQTTMLQALIIAVFAFSFLYVTLLLLRVDLEERKDHLEELKTKLGD